MRHHHHIATDVALIGIHTIQGRGIRTRAPIIDLKGNPENGADSGDLHIFNKQIERDSFSSSPCASLVVKVSSGMFPVLGTFVGPDRFRSASLTLFRPFNRPLGVGFVSSTGMLLTPPTTLPGLPLLIEEILGRFGLLTTTTLLSWRKVFHRLPFAIGSLLKWQNLSTYPQFPASFAAAST